jgi:hypothetical protein
MMGGRSATLFLDYNRKRDDPECRRIEIDLSARREAMAKYLATALSQAVAPSKLGSGRIRRDPR